MATRSTSDDTPDTAPATDELSDLNRRVAEEAAAATTAEARTKATEAAKRPAS